MRARVGELRLRRAPRRADAGAKKAPAHACWKPAATKPRRTAGSIACESSGSNRQESSTHQAARGYRDTVEFAWRDLASTFRAQELSGVSVASDGEIPAR